MKIKWKVFILCCKILYKYTYVIENMSNWSILPALSQNDLIELCFRGLDMDRLAFYLCLPSILCTCLIKRFRLQK